MTLIVAAVGCLWVSAHTANGSQPTTHHGLALSVRIDSDTLLPYEPIYATACFTNLTEDTLFVPHLPSTSSPDYPFDLHIISAANESLGLFVHCELDYDVRPNPEKMGPFVTLTPARRIDTLAPVATKAFTHEVVGIGFRDTWPTGHNRLPPGTYRVRAHLVKSVLDSDSALWLNTAAYAPFVVREATRHEAEAMRLYASALFFEREGYWNSPEFRDLDRRNRESDRRRRVDSCASAVIKGYPDVGAYVPMAMYTHTEGLWRRACDMLRGDTGNAVPIKDSAVAVFKRMVETYPNSSVTSWKLKHFRVLDDFIGPGTQDTYIRGLKGRFPGTKVDSLATQLPEKPGK